MKVKELIDILRTTPQDYDVRICSTNAIYNTQGCTVGCAEPIKKVFKHKHFFGEEVMITNGTYYFDAEKVKR